MGFHHEVVAVGPVDAAPFPGEEVEDLQVVSPSYPEDGVDVPHEVQEAAAALADKRMLVRRSIHMPLLMVHWWTCAR
eukprot:14346361-Ditylum_brightwellii.AAC.1